MVIAPGGIYREKKRGMDWYIEGGNLILGRRKQLLVPSLWIGRATATSPGLPFRRKSRFVTEIPPRRTPLGEPKICHTPHTLTILVVHAHA